ncbi:MAG: hypothetical protein KUG76_02885 [Gammaproteobacteria bacterium]|nr:hypothetical protein [Gammaproteobacteria bacterium]
MKIVTAPVAKVSNASTNDKRVKILSISHRLLEINDLSAREKTTYFLIVLFAVATVGSITGILVSIGTLALGGFGLYRLAEKKWLQTSVTMEDVSDLVALQNSARYKQAEQITQLLTPYRDQLLNPDLSNAALQEITEAVQQAII